MAGRRAKRARQARRSRTDARTDGRRERRVGQHFLRSRRLAAELVRDAGVGPDDLVFELGAGTGLLTAELARRARAVLAVELDGLLAAALRRRFDGTNAHVVEADLLEVPLPAEPFTVVANLPFGQTAGALRRLLDDPRTPLLRADLVVEWGAALKRARVWPSTQLGATWGAWYSFAIGRRLPAAAFSPPPGVDAAVLVVRRRAEPLVPVVEWRAFQAFVARGFAAGLRGLVPARRLRSTADLVSCAVTAAPRELDAHQWAALYEATRSVRPKR